MDYEEGLAFWLVGGAVVLLLLLLQVQTSFNIFGWMRFFLGSVFFFLTNSFHVNCPIPAMGRGTKKWPSSSPCLGNI